MILFFPACSELFLGLGLGFITHVQIVCANFENIIVFFLLLSSIAFYLPLPSESPLKIGLNFAPVCDSSFFAVQPVVGCQHK